MSEQLDAGRIGVFGASGSGKSAYVKNRWKAGGRIVVFDPLEEYGRAGFKVVRTLGQLRAGMVENFTGYRLAFVPPAGQEQKSLSDLCWLIHRAQERYRARRMNKRITLIVEELNLSFPNTPGSLKNTGMAELCSRGRHSGAELVGVSQRIAEVSTRFRGNLAETVVLMQEGEADLKAAKAALALPNFDRLNALKPLEYLHRTKARNLESGRVALTQKKNTKKGNK